MKKQFFSLEKICAIIFVILTIILTSAPYQGDSTLSSTAFKITMRYIMYFLTCFNGIIVLITLIKKKRLNPIDIYAIIPIIIYFFLSKLHVYSNDIKQLSNVTVVIWVIFCLSSDEIKIKSFDYFKKTFAIICFIGIVCYLSYVLKLPLKYSVTQYYLLNNSIYVNYGLAFIQGSISYPRLCCLFNEPGFLGTICALVLCADRLNLKKMSNLIIFMAGILSFSVGFFSLLFIYMVLNSWKNKKYLIITVITILLLVFVLPNIHTNISIIDRTLQRFTITETGLTGDNRTTEEFDIAFSNVMSKKPLFGMGKGYFAHLNLKEVLSYKTYILDYGIVGFIIIWGSLFISALVFRKYHYSILAFILLFFINIYQRPGVFNLQYELILFGGIAYLSNQIKLENNLVLARKKTKVMQFIHGLNTGGAETLVKDYSLKLNKKKFDIVVLCLSHFQDSPYEKILETNKIKVIYIDDYLIFKNSNKIFAKIINYILRFYFVKKIIYDENPKIIHIHLPICKYIRYAKPNRNVKLFYTMHGDPDRYMNNYKSDYNAIRWLLKKYDMKIICLYDGMQKRVNEIYNTTNTFVLNNGINFDRFTNVKTKKDIRKELNIDEKSFVIGHVGRFNKVKNHEFIVKIFNEIHKINDNSFLLMIGDGEEKNTIISLLKKYKLTSNYKILSNRDDIPDVLNAMDCFILPSLSEGVPISLIEAQKAKLPCVISENITDRVIISNLVKKIPLSNEKYWIDYLLNIKKPHKIQLNDDDWNIDKIVKKLEKIYLEKGENNDKKNYQKY